MKKLSALSHDANESLFVYAEFLARSREVMGPIDLEKLACDSEYKADSLSA